jgi:hypothetical protein
VEERIAVIGLGYVGLPVALGFAKKFKDVVGFDIHQEKVEELNRGYDRNKEVSEAELKSSTLRRTSDQAALKDRTFFVVAVPTPVDKNNVPDLTPVVRASETVGQAPQEGRRGGLRVDGLSRRHRRHLRTDPRKVSGLAERTSSSVTPRSASTRATTNTRSSGS